MKQSKMLQNQRVLKSESLIIQKPNVTTEWKWSTVFPFFLIAPLNATMQIKIKEELECLRLHSYRFQPN